MAARTLPRAFNPTEFKEWVERYAAFYQHGYDPAHCEKWTRFHYQIYLAEGAFPDFMRKN